MEKRKLRVTDGGYAVPLGNNYFLMKGKTHEQGGIGLSDKIEVENNEIVKVNKDSAKVYLKENSITLEQDYVYQFIKVGGALRLIK